MPTNNKNKTDKKHRNEKKEEKRNSPGLNYNTQAAVSDSSNRGSNIRPVTVVKKKKKKGGVTPKNTTKEGGSGYVYDPNKKRLNQLKKSNSVVSLVSGIADTVKSFKKKG